jgi:hypothetical protein
MIRPEARRQLLRWREAIVGGGLVLLGLWWLFGPGRLLTIPAIGLVVAGLALIWIGVQRARFRSEGDGPGAVQVDEGQIAYFGPLTGGAVALRELSRLTLDRKQYPPHWQLEQPGQPAVVIPVNAAGADALFDAFASLPGLKTERMLAALQTKDAHSIVIWQRDPRKSAQLPLH